MASLRFDNGREVITFVAPQGPYDRDLVNDAADVWKPIGDRRAGLAIILEGAQATYNRALHLRHVVAEADGVDQFAGVLISLGVEGVDVADAAAQKEKNDGIGLLGAWQTRVEFSILGPKSADGSAHKSAHRLMQHMAARNFAAWIKVLLIHIFIERK